MLAALLALSAAAEPVVAVNPFEVSGEARGLALAAASVIEDDLTQLPGLKVKLGSDKTPKPTHLVLGKVTAMTGNTRIDVRVVEVKSKKVLGSATINGSHFDEREPVLKAIAAGLKVPWPADFAPRYASTETIDAWGKALEKKDAKAMADVAEQWPDFAPAQRKVKK